MANRSGTNSTYERSAEDPALQEIRALLGAGSLDVAESKIDALLEANPEDPFAWDSRGVLAHLRGDPRVARSHTRRAIRFLDAAPAFHEHMALYLRLLSRPADAIVSTQRALELLEQAGVASPARCAALHDFWGRLAGDCGDLYASIVQHELASSLLPDNLEFSSNLAVAYAEHADHAQAALDTIAAVTRQAPDRADFHFNRGKIETKVGTDSEAIRAHERALQLDPTYVGATMELASLHERSGRRAPAEALLTKLLAAAPEAHSIRFNRGLLRLRGREWEDGFLDFEARYEMPDIPTPQLPSPRWVHPHDSASRAGVGASTLDIGECDLLIVAEQGLGDTIQFSRFCESIRRDYHPASITLQVHPRLHSLLAALPGVDRITSLKEPPPPHDVWTGLMSLPLLSGMARRGDFRHHACFAPSTARSQQWRYLLPERRALRVAIAWQGNPNYAGDATRSIPLRCFLPLLEQVDGLDLISLQAGDGLDQLANHEGVSGLHTIKEPLDAQGAFLDSAAILSHCDLLLSSDTSIVHLAASMGVATWVPTAHSPDWRWSGDGSASPWYDAVRLFRQPTAGDWTTTFQHIASALQELTP